MIQGATAQSVAAIDGIGGTIRQLNEIATTIASAVEEQGAATQEIARNVQQASAGTQEVSANIGGVSQAAAETGAAAAQVMPAGSDSRGEQKTAPPGRPVPRRRPRRLRANSALAPA